MDTTKTITHISLCAGYGGIDIGLSRAIPNLRTIAFSEIEAFACANLVSKMEAGLLDAAPIWTNLKTLPWGKFRGVVDILSGGYPCQPFSAAGKRLGTEDPRHLWPYIADGIAAMRPSVCFFENVEGHISLGLPNVIEDLGRLGYRSTWGIFSASEVGAPHQRKRVFIMAHCEDERLQLRSSKRWTFQNRGEWSEVWNQPIGQGGASGEELAHCDGNGSAAGISRQESWHEGATGVSDNHSGQGVWPSRPGQPQYSWEPPRVVANSKHNGLTPSKVGGGFNATASDQPQGQNNTLNPSGTSSIAIPEGAELVYSASGSNGQLPSEQQGRNASGGSGEERSMEDPMLVRRGGGNHGDASGDSGEVQVEGSCSREVGDSIGIRLEPARDEGTMGEEGGNPTGEGREPSSSAQESSYPRDPISETQPSLGGDPNGPTSGVGHAELHPSDHADCGASNEHRGRKLDDTRSTELHGIPSQQRQEDPAPWESSDLYTSCDNRTDELRLLGNGVVPATAELAWRTLCAELNQTN